MAPMPELAHNPVAINSEVALFLINLCAAEDGNAHAQYALANCFITGAGTAQDYKQAFHWYSQAANAGHPAAKKCLGNMHGNGMVQDEQNHAQAIHWFTQAAHAGDARGCFNLGVMYQIGHGIPQNYDLAFQWQLRAAEQGYALAQLGVALLFESGLGTSADAAKAFEWFLRAGEQNNATAQYNVGLAYEYGNATQVDMKEAARWYKRAALRGDYLAQVTYASLCAEGRGIEEDAEKAFIWFSVAAHTQELTQNQRIQLFRVKEALSEKKRLDLQQAIDALEQSIKANKRIGMFTKLTMEKVSRG